MRINTQDLTLVKNYLQKYQFLIEEYELVKQKLHPKYKLVKDFHEAHGTDRRSFLKYYNRFKQSSDSSDLIPQKRGPKWKSRRTIPEIEELVVELRQKGNNRYEIYHILAPKLKDKTPCPSTVYNICRRRDLNRLKPKMKEEKRKIIKEKAGELAHIDCHYLNKGIIQGDNNKYYLIAVIDDCTRLAWAEIVPDIKALTAMFTVLKCFNMLADQYQIKFEEVLTDNGPEFGKKVSQTKAEHPFERLLIELGIKHRYTRPYRPQTNGKVERFWRTIEADLLEETYFESLEHLKEELIQYLYYYNHQRPHQGINGMTPFEMSQTCPRIT